MPFFSVIIPVYNRYIMLKKAVDSVLSQRYKDFELIIVDDGSTDNTSCIESDYGDSIIYIRQSNKGVSAARNTGIKRANSPFIAFLDSDDLWLPNKLLEQHRYIKENPLIQIHQTDEIWIRNGVRVNSLKKHRKIDGDIFTTSLELCLVSPSSVVLKRELFGRYGLFDEDLPVCEDYDMWLRITCFEKAGLIRKKLIKKFGGHGSQLSRSYWGMDRFRIYAIIKLLKAGLKDINPEYYNKARGTGIRKCKIMLKGALKRGREEFAENIREIMESLESGNYKHINSRSLLKG
jgi:glycosyltransferase involved in cell wall biosynthesis